MRLVALLFVLTLALTGVSAVQAAEHDGAKLTRLGHVDTDQYELTYVERRVERAYDDVLPTGGTRTYPVDVRYDNLTRVDVVLSWTETGDAALGTSGSDTFRVEVTKPDGTPMDGSPGESASGVLVLRSDLLNEVPDRRTVTRAELAEARTEATTTGRGTWRVGVTLADTGDAAVDEENAYVLTVVIRHYEASPLRVVSLAPPTTAGADDGVSVWTWTTAGLGVASVGLGGVMVADHLRRRTA